MNEFLAPWGIAQDWMPRLRACLARSKFLSESGCSAEAMFGSRHKPDRRERTQVLALWGILTPRASILSEILGGTPLDLFGQEFDRAVNGNAERIVIDVDSPGGSVYGVHELAEKIYHARGTKPIIASINGLGASAAYQIASAADEIVVTPSGEVGSIGIIAMHEDVSERDKKEGLKYTLLTAGRFKDEESEHAPLTSEGRAAMQRRVDEYYETMTGDIARNRGVSTAKVRNGFGEGRVVGAEQARRVGLVDRVDTLQSAVGQPRILSKDDMQLAIYKLQLAHNKALYPGPCKKILPQPFHGQAIVFGSWSDPYPLADGSLCEESFLHGSLDEWWQDPCNVALRVDHEGEPVARSFDGTLRIKPFPDYLLFDFNMYSTQAGRQAAEMINAGQIRNVSPSWSYDKADMTDEKVLVGDQLYIRRRFSKISLHEISLCTSDPRNYSTWVRPKLF